MKEPTTSTLTSFDTRASCRLLSVLRSSSFLDRQLASGAPPGWSRSLAARAHRITSTERLEGLAQNWEHLLRVCHRPAAIITSRAPLCRARILAAEAEILNLVAALSAARLESVAGVATASMLLRDGSGPLYNLRSKTDLARVLRDVTRHIRNPAGAVSEALEHGI